jgi:hypothetical protein
MYHTALYVYQRVSSEHFVSRPGYLAPVEVDL